MLVSAVLGGAASSLLLWDSLSAVRGALADNPVVDMVRMASVRYAIRWQGAVGRFNRSQGKSSTRCKQEMCLELS
jgi:hypothetical protein